MKSLISRGSLSSTTDAVNDMHFWSRGEPVSRRTEAAHWIASRFGGPRAYAETFALFDAECVKGYKLFTGERIQSAAARHIAAEEACRALIFLQSSDRDVKQALRDSTRNLIRCLDRSESDQHHRMGGNPGLFCCGPCTVSVWRHVLAGGLNRHEERLAGGMSALKSARDRASRKWRRFPFWYTLSALVDMDLPQARAELKGIAKELERAAKREDASTYSARRGELARRALAKLR